MRKRREDTRAWSRRCGIEEARLYEIVKLRRQFAMILESTKLLKSRTRDAWQELSSKERRVKIGEKRKLNELKKKARTESRRRRVLKEDVHFDTIIDENSG